MILRLKHSKLKALSRTITIKKFFLNLFELFHQHLIVLKYRPVIFGPNCHPRIPFMLRRILPWLRLTEIFETRDLTPKYQTF